MKTVWERQQDKHASLKASHPYKLVYIFNVMTAKS